MLGLHVCLCTLCMPGAHKSQKVSDLLPLELQEIVNCLVGAWNNPGPLQKLRMLFTFE